MGDRLNVSPEEARSKVEVLERAAAAIREHDVTRLEQMISEDFKLHPAVAPAFGGATVYSGKEGVLRYFDDIVDVFDEFSFEPVEFSIWGDYLICPMRAVGQGKGSGVAIDEVMTGIWRVSGELVTWGATYFDRGEALASIGASEEELTAVT
jgi:hypothetical protein